MIGAARVMAAVHAPRMDAVRIKRGILSVHSLSVSDHSRRGSAKENFSDLGRPADLSAIRCLSHPAYPPAPGQRHLRQARHLT